MDLGVAEVAEAEVVDLEVEVEAEVEAGDNEQKKIELQKYAAKVRAIQRN